MSNKKVCAILVGSLRKNSNSGAVAKAIAEYLPDYEVICPEFGNLALFSEDLEQNPPAEWVKFRAQIKSADCLIFVTPEYNRGYTACLKNALDVGSRPNGSSVWSGKPGCIVSVSPGKIGGALANQQLKQICSFLNIDLLCQPECYIQADETLKNGQVSEGKLKEFIKFYAESYDKFVKSRM